MQHVIPAARGLRTIFDLASDRVWFGIAVVVGLFLASWLGEMALRSLLIPVDGGIGY